MLVSELIGGEILTCSVDTLVVDAANIMIANDAGSLAVMDDDELVGIVTERDLIKFVAGDSHGSQTGVGQVMTPNPDSLEPDVEVAYAADWMLAAGYRHLPVLEAGKLVGIVSIKDVLWGVTQGRDQRS